MTDNQWRELVRSMNKLDMNMMVIQEVFRNEQYVGGQQLRILTAQSLTMMFIQGKRLLIVGLKFLQANGYTSTLKEKATCQIKSNE